jgi:hypothetical protein
MEGELQRRMARNEALFREVNEAIASGQWPGEEDRRVSFRCECARLGCNDLIDVPLREYERVRANPRWFLISPGHEQPLVERVIESHPGYAVVEKAGDAGAVADATDPRD